VSAKPVYTREDCGFANLTLTKGVDAGKVKAKLYAQGATTPFATLDVAHRGQRAAKGHRVSITPPQKDTWNPVRSAIVHSRSSSTSSPHVERVGLLHPRHQARDDGD
jgi:hypothetical protein